MKQEDHKYNMLITRLKEVRPVAGNAEEMTAAVMKRISMPQKRIQATRIISIISWASATAAAMLLCLLISETISPALSGTSELKAYTAAKQKESVAIVPQAYIATEQTIYSAPYIREVTAIIKEHFPEISEALKNDLVVKAIQIKYKARQKKKDHIQSLTESFR